MLRWLPVLLIFALLAMPSRITAAAEPDKEPCYLGAEGHHLYVIPIQGDRPGLLAFQGPGEGGMPPALFAWLEGDEWR